MDFTKVIINYYKGSNHFNQIVLIKDGVIEYVEPFELKHHNQYLNLDITVFEEIDS